MFDDLFNASILTLILAIGAAAAASAFDADASGTSPITSIARHVVSLPTVVVVGRRASMVRDLALGSVE